MKKVLNLYAGIGGNRMLWKDVEVTAVEIDKKVADIYQKLFPDDIVIVGDAHQYLLDHVDDNWDLIWSSPPCPSHSRIRKYSNGGRYPEIYPDMSLWQEILFLQHCTESKWVVENVITYYEPLIKPYKSGRHYFWSNFIITNKKMSVEIPNTQCRGKTILKHKFWNNIPKQLMMNAVHPELGEHIFNCAFKLIPMGLLRHLEDEE